jgi:hypothetical protein
MTPIITGKVPKATKLKRPANTRIIPYIIKVACSLILRPIIPAATRNKPPDGT